MKIGIICAMDEELNSIISAVGTAHISEHNGIFKVSITKYHSHELIFILSGIGKVNAALSTQYLINKYMPQVVVNLGVAGGLSDDLNFGDVVVATDLVQHDVDVTAFGLPLGQIPRLDVFAFKADKQLVALASSIKNTDFKIVVGRIISGDQFINTSDHAQKLSAIFAAKACEMEGAAIAHGCYINNTPFLVVRSLSDKAGIEGNFAKHSFEELKNMAAERAASITKHLLLRI